ncbi:solute carrier family 22 member 7-like [Haliotis rubra]|uniref:solute carrier family 22 member 7-like n=1 Tax=Haliotis rubra TaxID=36100 RepID=UPI001EE53113|nr:solute carrier family 22 member 7-like [Haliotis rubra]
MAGKISSVDQVLEALGGRGRYQLFQYFVCMFSSFSASFQLFNIVFVGRHVAHTCKQPVNISDIYHVIDNELFQANNSKIYFEKCNIRVEANISGDISTSDLSCIYGYEYVEGKDTSLMSDMDIVCDRAHLRGFAQTVLIIGQGIGAFVLPIFSDRFGRRPVHLFAHLCFLGLGLGVAFAPTYTVFLVLRVFLGFVQQGIVLTKTTISIEIFPSRHRKLSGLLNAFLWTVATTVIALIAYLMQTYSWRTTQLVYCSVSLYVFVQFFLLDESLSWLITNNKTKQVTKNLKKAARISGKDYQTVLNVYKNIQKQQESENSLTESLLGSKDRGLNGKKTTLKEKDKTKPSFLDLMKRKRLAANVFVLWFTWITDSLTVFGLYMTAHSLAGSPHLNFVLYSLLEAPSILVFYFMVDRYGRKKTSMTLHGIAGIALLMATVCKCVAKGSSWSPIAVTAFSCIGMFGAGGAWGTSFFFTPEMFPTNLRNFGLGTSSACSRLGGMLAPFSSLLAEHVEWAPGTIFGVCCLLVTVLVNVLPETMGRELPQTVDDVEAWHKKTDAKTAKDIDILPP